MGIDELTKLSATQPDDLIILLSPGLNKRFHIIHLIESLKMLKSI